MQLPKKPENTEVAEDAASSDPNPNESEPDFSEFMWMASEDLEAFDQEVISELDETLGLPTANSTPDPEEQEEFLNNMLEEEEKDTIYFDRAENGTVDDVTDQLHKLDVSPNVAQSSLNPLAAEFVPSGDLRPASFSANQAFPGQPYVDPSAMLYEGPPSHSPIPGILPQASLMGQVPAVDPMQAMRNGIFHVYMQRMPMVPLMNNSRMVRPNQYFNVELDRDTDDEGYGDF